MPAHLGLLLTHVAEMNVRSAYVFDQKSFESMLDGLESLNKDFRAPVRVRCPPRAPRRSQKVLK